MSVASDADANNLEKQHRVLANCEQVFEDVCGASWNRPGLNHVKAAPQPSGSCLIGRSDCAKIINRCKEEEGLDYIGLASLSLPKEWPGTCSPFPMSCCRTCNNGKELCRLRLSDSFHRTRT